jgi:hypothetical protein
MIDDIGGVESSRGKISRTLHRPSTKACVVLTIVIATLIVSLPYAYSQLNPTQNLVQTMSFVLESPDSSWCSGEGRIWFGNGSFQLLSPFPAIFKHSILSDSDVWQAFMPVDGHFSEPITCNLEYICPGLNKTISSLSFRSDRYGFLYQDISGNSIYLSGGYVHL